MSVPVTLTDLERRGMMGQNFLQILIITLKWLDLEEPNLGR